MGGILQVNKMGQGNVFLFNVSLLVGVVGGAEAETQLPQGGGSLLFT